MLVKINGKEEILERENTIAQFLLSKSLNVQSYILLYNGVHLKQEDHGSILLKENDELEILRFVGGG